jgi:hypothetical protein
MSHCHRKSSKGRGSNNPEVEGQPAEETAISESSQEVLGNPQRVGKSNNPEVEGQSIESQPSQCRIVGKGESVFAWRCLF